MSTVARCPVCAYIHQAEKVAKQRSKDGYEKGWVWTNESIQGADGRWRAQPGENLDNTTLGEKVLAAFAERCRAFLEWYNAS